MAHYDHPDSVPSRPYEVLRDIFDLKGTKSFWLKEKIRKGETSFPHNGLLLNLLLEHVFSDPSYQWDALAAKKEQVQQAITDVFTLAFRKDPGTGAYGKEAGKFFADFIPEFKAANPTTPVAFVEIDFSNMGNANEAIGRERVDRAISIMKRIYEECLGKSPQFLKNRYKRDYSVETDGIDNHHGGVTCIRTGGDEMRFLVTGLDSSQIRNRLHYAQQAIAHFTGLLGTDTLEHAKYQRDRSKAGFGAGAGFIMLEGNENPEALQSAIDRKIADSKLIRGFQRVEEIRKIQDTLDRKNVIAPHSAFADSRRSTLAAIYDASKEKGLLPPATLRAILPKDHVAGVLQSFEAQYDPSKIYSKSEAAVFEDWFPPKPPAWPLPVSAAATYEDPYRQRLRDAEAYAAQHELNSMQRSFLLNAVQLYNSYDPVTGYKSQPHILDGIRAAAGGRDHPNLLVEAEMTNLAGLNARFNHEAADRIIRKAASVFKKAIQSELEGHVKDSDFYAGGGGKFRLVTHGIPAARMHQALHMAAQEIDREITQKTVAEICNELHIPQHSFQASEEANAFGWNDSLSALPHPKGKTSGIMMAYTGVEMKQQSAGDLAPYYLQLVELLGEAYSKKPSVGASDIISGARVANIQPVEWFTGNTGQPEFQPFHFLPAGFHKTASSNVRADRSVAERLLKQLTRAETIKAERHAGSGATRL